MYEEIQSIKHEDHKLIKKRANRKNDDEGLTVEMVQNEGINPAAILIELIQALETLKS